MADTTFVNSVTLTDADWFNDLNRLHYTIFGDPATLAALKTTTFGSPYPVNHGPVMRAAADQSITTNTTLASATNMSFAIAANEEWEADFDIDLNGVTALQTTGMKWAVTVPAGATLNVRAALIPNVVAGGTNVLTRATTTGGAAMDFSAATLPDVTAGGLVRISVWVLNSTNAGTVQLQVAQSTSSATALVIAKGSHGVATRVA